MSVMQDPVYRRYVPQISWGETYDWRNHECYVAKDNFVRGRCDCCAMCQCSKDYDKVELMECEDCIRCAECGNRPAHGKAIIIATDGACRNNGYANAQAACGIFFNINSIHNKAFLIHDRQPTSQRAELRAAIYALNKVGNMLGTNGYLKRGGRHITEVVIKSDSAYLVNGMTAWIASWRTNGYRNARGYHLKNKGLFQRLDALCHRLDQLGIQARFWHVPRDRNRQADELAKLVLDGKRWKPLSEDDWFSGQVKPPIH